MARHFCSLTIEYHCYWLVGGHTRNSSPSARDGVVRDFSQERNDYLGEFDPGSERTLAACLTHASRARKSPQGDEYSGERVSNTWATYPSVRNNPAKAGLIPNDVPRGHPWGTKGGERKQLSLKDGPAAD